MYVCIFMLSGLFLFTLSISLRYEIKMTSDPGYISGCPAVFLCVCLYFFFSNATHMFAR